MDMETIYRLYFRDVYLFLQGLTRSETLAEELTQETFFKALDGLKNFDGKQDVRAGWKLGFELRVLPSG